MATITAYWPNESPTVTVFDRYEGRWITMENRNGVILCLNNRFAEADYRVMPRPDPLRRAEPRERLCGSNGKPYMLIDH